MKEKIIIEMFYLNREKQRIYKNYSPAIRAERFGLLVLINESVNYDNICGKHGRKTN